ncbi:hypothetical protein GCM10008015_08960 [Flavobacterium palustre]|uniref:DUF4476 domain-containing protein n=2 Tax=Flavobacterium palustre TaxID=1476463 RepID=A0ABQ1HDP1_9FLAO|nr:hypothetical protein GCM10008015_08960 [Flavobacterium palustre]
MSVLLKTILESLPLLNKLKDIRQNTYYNLTIMKKRLEADLISIAHRILQLKDKSDINQLYLETQKLYEKLSVLKFIDENYADVKPTIGSYSEIEKEIETIFDKETALAEETTAEKTENTIIAENITEEAIAETTAEQEEAIISPETAITEEETISEKEENEEDDLISDEEEEIEETEAEFNEQEAAIEEEVENETTENEKITIPAFKAAFELTQEPEEETKKPETVQISFEDLLGLSYNEPEFVKVDEIPAPAKEVVFEPIETAETPVQKAVETAEKETPKTISLNEKFSKGIEIDLNDRIAFVKHLFGNSNEDYNRVMSQLITFDNFYETKSFIDDMVKPDYNNWEGKEEYEERFMEIIEKKFL